MSGIIGINAYHADASAAFIDSGKLIAAAEEERFNRIKHSAGFPTDALRYVVKALEARPGEVIKLAIPRDPWARFLSKAWRGIRMPATAASRLKAQATFASMEERVAGALGCDSRRIERYRVEHHRAHLASSFFVSPFDEAALFSVDGLGDFASTTWGIGRANQLEVLGAVEFPHSLGLFYQALTQYLGFPHYGDEYKVMGLAPFGEPRQLDAMRKIVRLKPGGTFELDLAYFRHHRQETARPVVRRRADVRRALFRCAGGPAGAALVGWRSAGRPAPRHRPLGAGDVRGSVLSPDPPLQASSGLTDLCWQAAARPTRWPTARFAG